MTDRVLVDTNVLVYAHDPSSGAKNRQAIEVLDRLRMSGQGAVSTQILMEFVRVVTSKIPNPLTAKVAAARARDFMASWPVASVTAFVVDEALRGLVVHRLALWDALVWATARMNQMQIVLSEDFGHDSEIEGVQFRNPFLAR
jgi:predicted nucleic acid-binding protein